MLGEGHQSSLGTASTYYAQGGAPNLLSAPRLHIFVNFNANESFAYVFIDNHTKSTSYFSDF